MLSEGAPTINLFKAKRTKGWWPFRGTDEESEKEILTVRISTIHILLPNVLLSTKGQGGN